MSFKCLGIFAVTFVITQVADSYSAATGYSCPTLFNFYADVHDCSKFYRCVWGQAFVFSCPAGTRWSQSILTCDHEYNVPCDDAPTHLDIRVPQTRYAEYDVSSYQKQDDGYGYSGNSKYSAYDYQPDHKYYHGHDDTYPSYNRHQSPYFNYGIQDYKVYNPYYSKTFHPQYRAPVLFSQFFGNKK